EQGQQPRVPDGGPGEDGRDAVQALELLSPMTVASGHGADAGMLVSQHQGDGLEPGAQARCHAAAPDSRLDLADGPGKHRDDVAAVARWWLLPRGATTNAGTALAWSSHRLLLWTPRHGRRGSMPHRPAGRARNVPGREPHTSSAEPTCGSPKIYAAGLSRLSPGPRTRRWLRSGDDDTGIPPPNDRPAPECLPHVNAPKRTPFPEPWPVPRPKRGPSPARS